VRQGRPEEVSAAHAAWKSEARKAKSERRPKPEIRRTVGPAGWRPAEVAGHSGFGLRISFGLRFSGFRISARAEGF